MNPALPPSPPRATVPHRAATGEPSAPRAVYRVRADRPHAERQGIAGETRVRVPLSGTVDERWRRAYRSLQLDSTGYFRYRLELGSPIVTFTGRHANADLDFFLNQLDSFLDLVNSRASLS